MQDFSWLCEQGLPEIQTDLGIVLPDSCEGLVSFCCWEGVLLKGYGILSARRYRRNSRKGPPKCLERNRDRYRVPTALADDCRVNRVSLFGPIDEYGIAASLVISDDKPCATPVSVFVADQGLSSWTDGIPNLSRLEFWRPIDMNCGIAERYFWRNCAEYVFVGFHLASRSSK